MTTGPSHGAPLDEPALEPIARDDCVRLLATQIIGRVAVADFNSAPLVVPVNFVLDGETVVFRCDYGTKFRLAVLGGQPVSFEVDALDPGRRSGWSVLVQGTTTEVDPLKLDGIDPLPWPGGEKAHWVRIVPESISGRHIRLPEYLPESAGYL